MKKTVLILGLWMTLVSSVPSSGYQSISPDKTLTALQLEQKIGEGWLDCVLSIIGIIGSFVVPPAEIFGLIGTGGAFYGAVSSCGSPSTAPPCTPSCPENSGREPSWACEQNGGRNIGQPDCENQGYICCQY